MKFIPYSKALSALIFLLDLSCAPYPRKVREKQKTQTFPLSLALLVATGRLRWNRRINVPRLYPQDTKKPPALSR